MDRSGRGHDPIYDFFASSINEPHGFRSLSSSSSESSQGVSSFQRQMESISDQLTGVISTERKLLDLDFLRLEKTKKKFEDELRASQTRLKQSRAQWSSTKVKLSNLIIKPDDIVELDIGGTHTLTTSLKTLTKHTDSTLAAMFSGRHPISYNHGKAFIDRDGDSFLKMMNFIRTERLPCFESSFEEERFYEELDYWNIPIEVMHRNIDPSLRHFDSAWCAHTLVLDANKTVLKKIGNPHGIAFGANPLNGSCPYVEFKINITAPSSNGSHVFVGVVDKSKYSASQLISTLWRDAPSSYYWDVWSNKLIKTDEQGVHRWMKGYGCDCEEDETIIGIYYDAKERSLSFYKQGINQGVAFTDVDSGLYPSIDVWFESGTVTLLQTLTPKELRFM